MTKGAGPLIGLTGGTGFVGRRLVPLLRDAGYRVRLLGRGNGAVDADEFRNFDLAGTDKVGAAAFDGCEAVLHLAAHIPANQHDPAEARRCMEVNAFGVLRLIEGMAEVGVGRLIQCSSANAYDPQIARPSESDPLFPRDRVYYLGSKIMQELLAGQACAANGIFLATLRLSSVYGPGASGAVSAIAGRIMRGEPVNLTNDGRFGADFVHVDDVCRAMRLLLGQKLDGIFNVGSGKRTTIRELAETLVRLADSPSQLVLQPPALKDDLGFPALNIEKLASLGYAPMTIDEGLRRIVTEA